MDKEVAVKQQKEIALQETYQFLSSLERKERKFGLLERLYLSQLAFTTGEIGVVKEEALRISKTGFELRYGILDEITQAAYNDLVYGSTLTKSKLEDYIQKRAEYQVNLWKLDHLNKSYQQNLHKKEPADIIQAEGILTEMTPLIKKIQLLKTEADRMFSELSKDSHFPQTIYQYLKQAEILAQNIGLPNFPLEAAVRGKLLLEQHPEMEAIQAFEQAAKISQEQPLKAAPIKEERGH